MSASISVIQKRFEKLDPSDDKYRPLLRELLSHQDLRLYAQGLHDTSLEGFIELLDEASEACIDLHWRWIDAQLRHSATFRSPTISFERPCADCKVSVATAGFCRDPTSF